MSRPSGLPPRPPGAIPAPTYGNNYKAGPRTPPRRRDTERYSPPRNAPIFEFRGNHGQDRPRELDIFRDKFSNNRDSYNSGNRAGNADIRGAPPSGPRNQYNPRYDREPRDDRRVDSRRSGPGRADAYDGGFRRSDVPRQPRDFDFRYDAPSGVALNSRRDNYRSVPPPRQAAAPGRFKKRDAIHRNENRKGKLSDRKNFFKSYEPTRTSERPFLQDRGATPELMVGMDVVDGSQGKFKSLEDMSDSDDTDMELASDQESADEDAEPKKKQARTSTARADGDSVPKWSNPDPYTALPPPDESTRKKRDVIKLIRKARVEPKSRNSGLASAKEDDFISFDFGDSDSENGKDNDQSDPWVNNGEGISGVPIGPRYSAPANAPKGPRLTTRDHFQAMEASSRRQSREDILDMTSSNSGGLSAQSIGDKMNYAINDDWKEHGYEYRDNLADPALGNRKRTFDDHIKDRPLSGLRKGKNMRPSNGQIVEEWQIRGNGSATPWCINDYSESSDMSVRLHKEIEDFYHCYKPLPFEDRIRSQLIADLDDAVRRRFRGCRIRPFGSYVAGLYLPTADMDLVMVSDDFLAGRPPAYGNRTNLFLFRKFLEQRGFVADDEPAEVITRAKVPLVKYVDRRTGLRVDVSFENATGLTANETFARWRRDFPAMPVLVTLVKHLLAMRGLNEPVNGGIGGFSVTCLVVALLQNMPQVRGGEMVPEQHLGEMLMEFLDLYGNEFDAATTAVRFDPPGYCSRNETDVVYKAANTARFSIIDPNNPGNDVSGGSTNTVTIQRCFREAYASLRRRMDALRAAAGPATAASAAGAASAPSSSILGAVLGGNYESFEEQREFLRRIYEREFGRV